MKPCTLSTGKLRAYKHVKKRKSRVIVAKKEARFQIGFMSGGGGGRRMFGVPEIIFLVYRLGVCGVGGERGYSTGFKFHLIHATC